MVTVDFPVDFPVDIPADIPVDIPAEIKKEENCMNKKERVSALWEILREDYGIETMEQFQGVYSKLQPIDISAFVELGSPSSFPKP